MALTYKVNVVFSSSGSIMPKGGSGGSMKEMNKSAESMMGAVNGIGDAFKGVGSAVDGVVTKLMSVVSSMNLVKRAMSGIVMGMGGNAFQEQTRIGMAGEFQAAGVSSSFEGGERTADAAMRLMRKKAAALPGTYQDLVNIFNTSLIPMMRGGASVKQAVDLSAQTMAVGISRGIRPDVIGREAAAILAGQAKGSNLLAARVLGLHGASAAHFNKLTPEARFKYFEREMNNPGRLAASDKYTGTLDTQWTTALENVRTTMMSLTQHLFESVKSFLSKINQWFDQNKTAIVKWADEIGYHLAKGFDAATTALVKMMPYLKGVADILVQKGENGTLMKYLGRGAAGMVGLDALGGGMKMGGSMLTGVAGMLAPHMKELGPILMEAGPLLPMVAAGIAVLAVQIVGFAAAVFGAVNAITDSTSPFHALANVEWDHIKSGLSRLGAMFEELSPKLITLAEMFGVLLLGEIEGVINIVATLAEGLMALGRAGSWLMDKLNINLIPGRVRDGERKVKEHGHTGALYDDEGLLKKKGKIQDEDSKAKGHRTYINKVEIQVNSNQDPSRIARMTVQELTRLSERTLQSDKSMNWSRGSNAR